MIVLQKYGEMLRFSTDGRKEDFLMKLHKTGKMVRILSMVLVVAIMMSVCLVQAFAASSRTETINGYSATAPEVSANYT